MTQKNENPIVTYEDADQIVEVRLDARHDTVWLRQEQMSQLFGRERSVITRHLRNVFAEGELDADSVCTKFAHTAAIQILMLPNSVTLKMNRAQTALLQNQSSRRDGQ